MANNQFFQTPDDSIDETLHIFSNWVRDAGFRKSAVLEFMDSTDN